MSHCVFLDFGIVEMNFLEGYILLYYQSLSFRLTADSMPS